MDAPVSIGTDRQLFLDDFWIDHAKIVERRLHQPVPREIAIASEKPWEGRGVCYMVAFPDGDGYRSWYRCDPPGGEVDAGSITAYAVSADGIHWEKPDVGTLEFEGSTDNNLVWTGPAHSTPSTYRSGTRGAANTSCMSEAWRVELPLKSVSTT